MHPRTKNRHVNSPDANPVVSIHPSLQQVVDGGAGLVLAEDMVHKAAVAGIDPGMRFLEQFFARAELQRT